MKIDVFNKRYKVIAHFPKSEGGAGEVYKARDKKLNRDCAVKVLKQARTGDSEFIKTFKNEIAHLQKLRHENIINILDYGSVGDEKKPTVFYVMEFATQGTLSEFAKSFTNFKDDHNFLLRLLSGIVNGLKYIHNSGRLHLDIKPQNILFNSNTPIISDFGVTKKIHNNNNLTYIYCTSKYAHPDLLKLESHGPVPEKDLYKKYYFDFYSLGKSIEEILPLCKDFHRRQLALIETLLDRLLEKEPYGSKDRYKHADELFEDIIKLSPLYLQPAGISELAPAFVNTSPCRIPPYQNVALSHRILKLIDTPILQRLRQLPQIEGANFVYPGATHTRFEHSIGTYQKTREIFNSLLVDPQANIILRKEDIITGLVSALLNDIGTYPFAHILEELGPKRWPLQMKTLKADLLLGNVDDKWKNFRTLLNNNDNEIDPERIKLIVCQNPTIKHTDKILQSILHGLIGANRLDYVERDSIHCGVPYGLMGDKERLFSSMILDKNKWVLALNKKGLVSAQIYILAFYTMISEVYRHHTVRAIASMIKEGVTTIKKNKLKSLTSVILDLDVNAFLDWCIRHATSEGQRLLKIVRLKDERKFYKRIFTLSRKGGVPTKWNTQNQKAMNNLEAEENRNTIRKSLKKLIASTLRQPVGKYDILFDIPEGKDNTVLDELYVQCPSKLYNETDEFHSIKDMWVFNPELANHYDEYAKKARIFIRPDLIEGKTKEEKESLAQKIFVELSK